MNEDLSKEINLLINRNKSLYSQSKSNLEKEALMKENDLLNSLLKMILYQRTEKIINIGFNNLSIKNLTSTEKKLYDYMINIYNLNENTKTSKHLNENTKTSKHLNENTKTSKHLISVINDIPGFVGVDSIDQGPYKKGDVALIAYDDYKMLVKEKLVKEIK